MAINCCLFLAQFLPLTWQQTKQAPSLSMSPNNINTSEYDRESPVAIDFVIKNKGMEESKGDTKISLKV